MTEDDEVPPPKPPEAVPPEERKWPDIFGSYRHPPRPPKNWKLIDKELARTFTITENGKRRKVTVFEAIVSVLEKEMAKGSRRAFKILELYEGYATAHPKTIVRPNWDPVIVVEIYDHFCRTGVLLGTKVKLKPRKPDPEEEALTEEERFELYRAFCKARKEEE